MAQMGNSVQDEVISLVTASTLYLALYTTAPTNSGGGVEVSSGGYARVAIVPSGWSTPSGHSPESITNLAAISFPQATADWGTVVAWALMDAASSGHLLTWNAFGGATPVFSGDIVQLAANTLNIQAT